MLESMIPAAAGIAVDAIKMNNQLAENKSARDYDYNKWREYVHEIDPKTQVKKMRAAGINPAVALSQGAIDSGNPSAQAPEAKIPQFDFSATSQGFRDSVELYQQSLLQKSQRENLEANTQNQLIRNKTQLVRDFQELFKMYSETDKNSKEGQLLWEQIQYTKKQIEAFDAQNSADLDLKHAQAQEHNAHADYLRAQEAYQKILNQYAPKQQQLISSNLEKQGRAIMAAANRDDAEAARAAAEKAVAEARKEGLDISNDQADALVDAVVDKAYCEADEQYWKSQQAGKRYIYGSASESIPLPGVSNQEVPQRPGYARHHAKRKRSKK